MLTALLHFLAPAQWDQRARNRERRALVVELERHPYVLRRLAELDQADGIAALDHTRKEARA